MKIRSWIQALQQSRTLAKGSLDIRYALAEACLIGLFSAGAAILLRWGIGWLGGWRIVLANQYGSGLVLPLFGFGLCVLAGWMIEQFSPESGGGGISHVKSVLADFPLALSWRTALFKTIGTILVLGAGLTLGRRGPTVQIGAALAAQLSRWVPTSPQHRRQMIAAGAAAGLAASFNTPIAGVMFVIEELMRDVSDLTLETAILASFTGAVVSRIFGAAGMNIPTVVIDAAEADRFIIGEIPTFVVLGVLAGLFGGLFNRGILFSFWLYRRLNWALPWRMGLAGLISATVIVFSPALFRDYTGLREYLMTSSGNWQTTATAFSVYFILTLVACGSGAPGGLFAPALLLGSALGGLVGVAAVSLSGTGTVFIYALTGMGAFFTGVIRVPVTAIVIVFEMTADFNLVLPLMISCAVAYLVGESVSSGSLYQQISAANGIDLNAPPSGSNFLYQLTAAEVMQSEVEVLDSNLSKEELIKTMSASSHHSFPVLEQSKLVGIVSRSDMGKIVSSAARTKLKEIMTPQPLTVNSTTPLCDVLYLLNRYRLTSLPVMENSNLVGIITLADIIQAEAQQLSGLGVTKAKLKPSYIVYHTSAPSVGQGRILLPLSNPHNAPELFKIAEAIARQYNYEIECLQVISIPKHCTPSQTKISTAKSRRLMLRMERLGRQHQIPVHTQIRVAQNVAAAIIETVAQRRINLVLMGWKGVKPSSDFLFSSVVDTLIKQVSCDLILVKLGHQPYAYPHPVNRYSNWLIPTAGGVNIPKALQFLPALLSICSASYPPNLELCRIYPPGKPPQDNYMSGLKRKLQQQLRLFVISTIIPARSVSEALIHLALAKKYSLIIIGASQESLLHKAFAGDIPAAVTKAVDTTVIIVRTAK